MMIEELKKKYKQVYQLSDGNYTVSVKSKNEVNQVLYEAHTSIDEVYGLEGKWGLVNQYGEIMIKPNYIFPLIECGDNYQVMQEYEHKKINGKQKVLTLKHGLIDKKGNTLIPIKYLYMEAMDDSGEYFRVVNRKNYKSGVINKENQLVIPFKYEFIQASPDLILGIKNKSCYRSYPKKIYQVKVSNNNLYGIYDLKLNKEIIKTRYKYIKIIDYNKFLIGEDYNNCHTLINEKEEKIEALESEGKK